MIRLRFEYSAAQVLATIWEFSRHASEPAQLSPCFGDRGCSRLKDLIFREAADCDLQQLNTAHFLKNPDFNTSVQLRAGAPRHFQPTAIHFMSFICVIVFPFGRLSTKLRQTLRAVLNSDHPKVRLMRYIDDHKAGPFIGVIHINNHPLDLLWRAWGNSAYGTGWEETCWRGGGADFGTAARGCVVPCPKRASCPNTPPCHSTVSDASSGADAGAHSCAGARRGACGPRSAWPTEPRLSFHNCCY